MSPLNKANHKRHWPARQRGAVAVLLTVALVALLAMAGLALDGGHLLLNKARLQNAVDAAALSGAKTLGQMKGEGRALAASLASRAARDTLMFNANAEGNEELRNAIDDIESFADVWFSDRIDGGFSPILTDEGKYVRVTVAEYGLVGFFWRLLDSIGDGVGDKQVAAMAVAGSAPSRPCEIMPLMVCGDTTPDAGTFWGYRFGQLQVLKMAAGDQSSGNNSTSGDWDVGPGNFHLLRIGDGGVGPMIESGMAGGINQCTLPGDGLSVDTQPGNMVGPVRKGYNTRFNDGSTTQYPSDYMIQNADGNNYLSWDEAAGVIRSGSGNNAPVVTSNSGGEIYKAGGGRLYDYPTYLADTAACIRGGGNCQSGGAPWRRILRIVVAECPDDVAGADTVPVLGYGCFFALQMLRAGGGNESNIFGQFVESCDSDGYAGPTPSADSGPEIIQLYRAYGSPGDDA